MLSPTRLLQFGLPTGILALGILGYSVLASLKAPPAEREQEELRPLVVTVPLAESGGAFDVVVDGTVVPKREVAVNAQVAGLIVWKAPACEAGLYVTAGTPLLQIEREKYELEVQRLRNLVEQASVEIQQLEVEQQNTDAMIALWERDVELRNAELKRATGLHLDGTLSDSERDRIELETLQARTQLQQALNSLSLVPPRLEKAQAELAHRRAQLAAAELDLSHTEIVAPIDGYVSDDPVEERTYVSPGATLVRIEDTSAVEVSCSLRVEDVYWLWSTAGELPPAEAELGGAYYEAPPVDATISYALDGQSVEWEGKLVRFAGSGLDPQTRTVPCRVEVPQPRRLGAAQWPTTLVRGMFVTVRLHAEPRIPLLKLPPEAVQLNNEVWTVENGQLQLHPVKVAKVLPEAVLVRADGSTLEPGARLVVTPLTMATPGMQVREEASP